MRRVVRAGLMLVVTTGVVVLLGSALGQWIPGDTSPVGEVVRSPGMDRVTVEVRNAGGVAGMARTATDHLRRAGFDVVALGNAARFDQERSIVIDRVGEPQTATAVARTLGIDSVKSEPDPNLFVDVTVRLGSDWTAPQETGSTGENPLPGWLRRLGPEKGNER